MTYKQKGSPLHKHMVNSWEEEDVKRGEKLEKGSAITMRKTIGGV